MIKLYRYVKWVLLFSIKGFYNKYVGIHFSSNLGKLKRYRNSTLKRRCFIVATGPSLTKEDLELIKDEVTFGVNSIFLMFDKTDWRPTYYVCTDSGYFEKIVNEYKVKIKDLSCNGSFLNAKSKRIEQKFGKINHTNYISFSNWNRLYHFKNYRFSDDLVKGLYAFGTVTNIVIAIAMYMGFKEIYLIGADCSNLNKHFINDVTDKDKDDAYVRNTIDAQLKGYLVMRSEVKKRGVQVFNATRGGELEVFNRVQLESVLKKKAK